MSLAVSLERFHFEFARTVGDARRSFDAREGLEVSLLVDEMPRGVGEASPLPGYSDDTLDECERALRTFPRERLEAVYTSVRAGRLEAARGATARLPPAARFALEAACVEACASERGIEVASLLGGDPRAAFIPALLVDPFDERPADDIVAASWARAGGAVKLKIGIDRERELALATDLRRRLGGAIELRFDANRSLCAGEDDEFLRRLVALGNTLVEEPFATDALPYAVALELPLALDESLRALSIAQVEDLLASGAVRAIVLKPTVLGLLDALAWLGIARAAGVRAIPSHTYEGPIGRRVLADFARCCSEPFPGLDESAVCATARGRRVSH